jgi:hypothetical protein
MQTTPYRQVSEAGNHAAILAGYDGHDKATVLRRTRQTFDAPDVKVLSDDEWQRLIYLIDAAPAMLDALEKARIWLECEDLKWMNTPDWETYQDLTHRIRTAKDLATKGFNEIA